MNIEYTNTIKVLNDFAEEVIAAYRAGLERVDALASHKLHDRITVNTVSADGGKMLVSLNLMGYWKYVENGRAAGSKRPPISAITEWMEWKNILPYETGGIEGFAATTPSLSQAGAVTDTSTLRAAFAIANKIARDGIEPKPILRESVEETWKAFKEAILAALRKDLATVMVSLIGGIWSGYQNESGGTHGPGNYTDVYTDVVKL